MSRLLRDTFVFLMGQMTQRKKNVWGIHSRLQVRKDAGVLHPRWGRSRIYFALRKPYSVVKNKKGECHERFRDCPVPLCCPPRHPVWGFDPDWRVDASQRIQLLAEVRFI